MDINEAFGRALKEIRQSKGISQEKLSFAASRVYVSSLERGLKSPTLSIIDKLSKELDIHPISLLVLTYCLYEDLDKYEVERMLSDARLNVQ